MKIGNVMHMRTLTLSSIMMKLITWEFNYMLSNFINVRQIFVKFYYQIMDYITIERNVDDKARQLSVIIHLLKLIIGHNQLAHAHDLEIMNDIAPTWMKH
jgi:hypothetical protein